MTAPDPPAARPVGAADMDAEHQLLHDLLHQLQSALEEDRQETVSQLLGRFQDAANLHFMEEQSLMRLHAYPGYEEHQREHDELIEELQGLAGRITAGELGDAAQAAARLEEWLTTHMHTTDAALEQYLEDQGIHAP